MILLCSLDVIFAQKKINLIQLHRMIEQNGHHLVFYQGLCPYIIYTYFNAVTRWGTCPREQSAGGPKVGHQR